MCSNQVDEAAALIQSMKHLWPDFNVNKNNLEQPRKEFVLDFCSRFRSHVKDAVAQITGEDQGKTPELSEVDLIIDLLHYVNSFLKHGSKQGFPDCNLTLTDFYCPSSKRTKVRIKILLNVLYDLDCDIMKKVVMRRKEQVTNFNSLCVEKEKCMISLAEKVEELVKNEDEGVKLQKELKERGARYATLQDQKDNDNMECKKIQHDFENIFKTYQNKQTLLDNVKAHIVKLNEGIIDADVYNSLCELKQNLVHKCEELDEGTRAVEDSLSNKVTDIDDFKVIYQEIETLLKLGSELQKSKDNYDSCKKEIQEFSVKYAADTKQVHRTNESIVKLKNVNKEENATIPLVIVKNTDVVKKIKSQIEQIEMEIKEENELHKTLIEQTSVLKDKYNQIMKKLKEETDYMNNLNQQYKDMYTRILNVENKFMQNFINDLDNIRNLWMKGKKGQSHFSNN